MDELDEGWMRCPSGSLETASSEGIGSFACISMLARSIQSMTSLELLQIGQREDHHHRIYSVLIKCIDP